MMENKNKVEKDLAKVNRVLFKMEKRWVLHFGVIFQEQSSAYT